MFKPTQAWLLALANNVRSSQVIPTNGDTTSASPTVLNVANAADLPDGASIFGPGIPAGTTVLSKTGTTVTLSQNATASTAGVDLVVINGAAGPALDSAKAVLGTSTPPFTRDTVLADLTAPTFATYAEKVITWASTVQNAAGDLIMTSQELVWQPTAGTNLPQTVFSWGLSSEIDAVETLLGGDNLATPIALASTLTALRLIVQMKIPYAQVYGDVIQVIP